MNRYSGPFYEQSILKRGEGFSNPKLKVLPLKSDVKPIKLSHVKKLIETIGINRHHEAYDFYENIEKVSISNTNSSED